MAAFFTLVFPTTFLVVICAIAGNAVMDDRSGVRLAQFLTPVFAVFGVCMASFVSLALGVAYSREAGVLKRLRTTPLPPWIHLAGRLTAAVFVSLVAVVLVVGIGVAFYGVDIVWRTLPAVLLTLIVGIACFAALGMAAVSITPTPGATQALANGGLILLAFISDVFIVQAAGLARHRRLVLPAQALRQRGIGWLQSLPDRQWPVLGPPRRPPAVGRDRRGGGPCASSPGNRARNGRGATGARILLVNRGSPKLRGTSGSRRGLRPSRI